MNARVLIALVLVAVFALGAVVLAAPRGSEEGSSGAPRRFEGATLPAGLRAPDFTLRDQDGEPVRMRALRGRPAIVTFLYTTCEDTCPAQAQQIKGALAELSEDVPARVAESPTGVKLAMGIKPVIEALRVPGGGIRRGRS